MTYSATPEISAFTRVGPRPALPGLKEVAR